MPLRKRTYVKRRFTRRRPMRKSTRPSRVMSSFVRSGCSNIKLSTVAAISSNVSGVISATYSLTDVYGISEFTDFVPIYDKFIIRGMLVELFTRNIGDESATIGPHLRGNLGSVVDFDGPPGLASFAGMAGYSNFKIHPARAAKISRYVRVDKRIRPEYCDTNAITIPTVNKNASIQFYGDNYNSASLSQYWVKVTFYVTFSGRR